MDEEKNDFERDIMTVYAFGHEEANEKIKRYAKERYTEFWQGTEETYKQFGTPDECIDFELLAGCEDGKSFPLELKDY